MSTLYELSIWRDGDTVGTVLFVSDPPEKGVLPAFVVKWCANFTANVSHDRATLSIVKPGRVTPDGLEMVTRATLVREWPPQW